MSRDLGQAKTSSDKSSLLFSQQLASYESALISSLTSARQKSDSLVGQAAEHFAKMKPFGEFVR